MINQITRRLSQASAAHRAIGKSQTEAGATYTFSDTLQQEDEEEKEK